MRHIFLAVLLICLSNKAFAAPLVKQVFDGIPAIFKAGDSPGAESHAKNLIKKVEAVLTKVSESTKKHFILPDKMAELTLRDARLRELDGGGSRLLLLSKGGKAANMADSVVIVDGDVEISFAERCIIVATGGVSVSHGKGNIIFAGYYVSVSHDGPLTQPAPTADAPPILGSSLIMSGNLLEVSHAEATVVGGAGMVSISHATGVVGLNLAESDISHRNDMGELIDAALVVPKLNFTKVADGKALYQPDNAFQRFMPPVEVPNFRRRESDLGTEYCFEGEGSFRIKAGGTVADCCGPRTKQLGGFTYIGTVSKHLVFKNGRKYAAIKSQRETYSSDMMFQATRDPAVKEKMLKGRVCRFES